MNNNERIKGDGYDYGKRGESTGRYAYMNGCDGMVHEIRVGDVVCYTVDGLSFCAVVLKDNGRYGLMGRGIEHLNYQNLTICVPYDRVPVEMISALHGVDFEYVEEEPVEMTLDEIERIVGRKVKIVKGD